MAQFEVLLMWGTSIMRGIRRGGTLKWPQEKAVPFGAQKVEIFMDHPF